MQMNMQYTFTISIGQGLTNPLGHFTDFSIEIADATANVNLVNQEFHGTGQDVPDVGTFYDYSVTFNGNDVITGKKGAPKAGDLLELGWVLGAGVYATDARLDMTPTPEPSMLVLLASGLIGLSAYGWRRRTKSDCHILF
jgi:hypothetical protein